MISDNVIHIDLPTWYCMRQCRESIKWCRQQKNPKYDIEIKGEEEIFRVYMDEVLQKAA